MIYKNKKLIQDINGFNKMLVSKFGKKLKSIRIHGSYTKLFFDYVTDIDFVIMGGNKYFKEIFKELIEILKEKKTIIQKLSIKNLSPDYFTKNNISVPNLNIEENVLMYRKWNAQEIDKGIKIDSLGNMINLEDILEYHILNHKTYITLDFLYKINSFIYIPISIVWIMKKENKHNEIIFENAQKYYELGNFQKTYARLCSCSHIILKQYNITDTETIYFMTEIKKYEKLSYSSNLLGSIKVQIDLVGEVENYKPNIKMIINSLYRIVESKPILSRLYRLKKNNNISYYDSFNEIKQIMDIMMVQNNNFLKPHVEKLYTQIKKIYQRNLLKKKKTKKPKILIIPNNEKINTKPKNTKNKHNTKNNLTKKTKNNLTKKTKNNLTKKTKNNLTKKTILMKNNTKLKAKLK